MLRFLSQIILASLIDCVCHRFETEDTLIEVFSMPAQSSDFVRLVGRRFGAFLGAVRRPTLRFALAFLQPPLFLEVIQSEEGIIVIFFRLWFRFRF